MDKEILFNKLKTKRNILFKAWVINIIFVLIFWIFLINNYMQYFIWAIPDFTLDSANYLLTIVLCFMDILGFIVFLVPAIAITWELHLIRKIKQSEKSVLNKK